jgi:arylsulfatase
MRIRFRWFLGAVLFFCPLGTLAGVDAAQAHPNVIIILVDTLRADHLGCYGFPGNPSPVIDKFAKSAVFFERCATPAPWTKPAVTSLFTGLYVETHHVQHSAMNGTMPKHIEVLPQSAVTMAETFAKAGYHTIGIVSNPWVQPESGLSQGFQRYDQIDRMKLMDAAADWIRTSSETAPFFLYVHVLDVHGHYLFDEKDFQTIRKRLGKDGDVPVPPAELADLQWYMKATFDAHPERIKSTLDWRAAYAAGVHRFDGRMPLLLDAIRDKGLFDNSIVIFTADHGEGLLQHGVLEHGKTLNLEEIHIPLMVRLPKGEGAGRRVSGWVSLVDVFPTLVDLCHLDPAGLHLQGQSLATVLRGKPAPDRVMFTSAMMLNDTQKSAIHGRFHLISQARPPVPPQLFDIQTDAGETHNIAPTHAKEVHELDEAIAAHIRAQSTGWNIEQDRTPMTDETREQLKSLGYTQ